MSPIKGLTEKRRLPRLGKIHLGIKTKNPQGVEYPRAVDYFVCPPEVQKAFGEQPRLLRILIPVEDEERWASQYYRCYSASRGLICKGDGEVAIRLVDTKTGDLANRDSKEVILKELPCQGRQCSDYAGHCKEIMNLQFLLPEVPGLGIWQIDTGSINSILNINSAADLIKRLYGRVNMIPLNLTLEPQEVSPDGKKKTIWVLNLRADLTLAELAVSAHKGESLFLSPGEDVMLPVGDDEIPDLIIPENQEPKTELVKVTVQRSKPTSPDVSGPAPVSAPPPPASDAANATQRQELMRLGKLLGYRDEQIIKAVETRLKKPWANCNSLEVAQVINDWEKAVLQREQRGQKPQPQDEEELFS